ncbi:MAG TPA: glycosyltransferase family 4 protein [Rhodocyclaceae bacterium]
MRMVFVTGSLVHGGAERHTITLLNRLTERGHECHALYVKDDPSQLARLRPGAGGSIACLEARRFFDRAALAELAARFTALQPSVIVAANDYAAMYAVLARWLAGTAAPILATFHSTKPRGAREQAKMLIGRCLFPSADCLVFVSSRQCRYWRRRGLWARRIEVIHNGVDAEAFSPPGPGGGAAVRRRFGFAAGDFVVGMVAVMRPEKNHVQLLDALALLRAQGVPARALMIGDGPLRGEIEHAAQARGLAPFVSVTGLQEDVRPYVAACDAVALCSVTEAFSLAAVEAMAMARPVVHSDVGGAREMIVDGHDGYLFPVGDTAALAGCLARLADPGRAAAMGASARRSVEARFTESAMVDRYERLCAQLCAGLPAPEPPAAAAGPAWPPINNECETRSQST